MNRALLAVSAVLAFASPAFAQSEDPGVIIGSACAELWTTTTTDELTAVVGTLNEDYAASSNSLYEEGYQADLAYYVAADEYRTKYVATINAVLDLAGKAGNMEVWQKAWDEGNQRATPQGELDGLMDMVIDGRGTEVLTHVTDILISDATVDTALAAEHAAKQTAIAARREQLAVNARIAAMETIIDAVEVCRADQQAYIEGKGPAPAN